MEENSQKKYVSNNAQLMLEWNWEKNNLLGIFPSTVTSHSNKMAWWKCNRGHSWEMSPDKKMKSKGCPYCLNKRVLIGYNDLTTLFPDLSKEWDFSKNQIDINSVVIGGTQQIHWICSKCQHKWIATLRNRTQQGTGCPECAKKYRVISRAKTNVLKNGEITGTLLLKEWDYEKNAKLGLFPSQLTPHSNKKAWWKCSTCGYEWKTAITSRSAGGSCPLCSNKIVIPGINDLCTTHPSVAKERDYVENGLLLPQNVSYGSGKKVGWECPLGHKYKATILHRSSGTNCPLCNSGRQTSFAEQAIFYYVKKLYPNAVNRYRDIFANGMEIDIYIPDIRYGIEYDGSFWHKPTNYEREKRKYELCKSNKIKLIRLKAFKEDNSTKTTYFADDILFLKEDNILELQKAIQNLCLKLYHATTFHQSKDQSIVEMVNIEQDRYKISNYLYEQTGSFADEYPKLALEWHPTKNENATPNMFRSGSSFLAWWICSECGHEWKTNIYFRAQGRGCQKCSQASHSGAHHYKARKIYQYAKDGTFIREWESISEASQTEKINHSNLSMCAEGKRAIAGGFRWSFEYFEKLLPIQKQQHRNKGINGKPVVQLDSQRNVLNQFTSLCEAEKQTGVNATSISKAINGHIKTAGGFIWEISCLPTEPKDN